MTDNNSMLRTFSIALTFFVLAQFASTSATLPVHSVYQEVNFSTSDVQNATLALADGAENDETTKIPRNIRSQATAFSAEPQTKPAYVLVTEFFEEANIAAVHKNLINPPITIPWFERHTSYPKKGRISAWKDGNALYTAKITYHS